MDHVFSRPSRFSGWRRAAAICMAATVFGGSACQGEFAEDDALEGLVGILVTPDNVILPVGQQVHMSATGLLEDRTSTDLTATATWSVTNSNVGSISNAMDSEGVLSGVTAGTLYVSAKLNGIASPEAMVTVTDAELERITITPDEVELTEEDNVQMSATALFSDGTTGDVSAQVRWKTYDSDVVMFGDDGMLEAAGAGTTTIECSWDDLTADAVEVTVFAASAAGEPNLSVSAASGSVSGGYIDLSVTIENDGDASASGFWLDIFVDPTSTPSVGDYGDSYEYIDYLAANDSDTLTYQLEADSGSHTIYVMVDTNDDIDESNESDNTMSATVSGSSDDDEDDDDDDDDDEEVETEGPDLSITYFDYLAYDTEIYYYVDITNTGDEDAGSFYVDVFVDEDDEPEIYDDGDDYTTIESLAVGETEYADFLIEEYCTYCWSWVLVDSYDSVEESDETNNTDGPLTVYSE